MYIIYRLTCDDPSLVYFGSTTQSLHQRLHGHKTSTSCASRILFEAGNVKIDEMEACKDKKHMIATERWWIENYPCVNLKIPNRNNKEWQILNKERKSEQAQHRYHHNREDILEKQRQQYQKKKAYYQEKIMCECGKFISRRGLTQHKQRKVHQEALVN